MEVQCRNVKSANGNIEYQLMRKDVKNINLRVRADGSVGVSASINMDVNIIDRFVQSKAMFIEKNLKIFSHNESSVSVVKQYISGESVQILGRSLRVKVIISNTNSVISDGVYLILMVKDKADFESKHALVQKYIDKLSKDVFHEVALAIYPLFAKYDVPMPKIRVINMDTRWGSCIAHKQVISINSKLIEASRSCIEYVVAHEFCHLIHANHAKQFYTFFTMVMPDWQQRKQQLEEFGKYRC